MTTPDFTKIWASESPLTPYTFDDDEYLEGWATIGEIPPDRRQFDEWQRLADTKMKWLKDNILGYLLRQNSTEYQVGDIAFSPSLPSSLLLKCTTAGTTASSEPDFSGATEGGTVTDGTVTWTYRNILSGNSGVGVGFIMPYAGTGLQEGWLDCDGSAVSRTMYPDLFAAIGTTWGAGDGSTTFNLPRSEDLVLQGASATNPVGTYKTAGLPNIEGTFSNLTLSGSGYLPFRDLSGALVSETTGTASVLTGSTTASDQNIIAKFDASQSNSIYGNSTTVQPPAACVRYMIKAFDGPTPSSAGIDLTQYAADLANKADRSLSNLTQAGEARFAHVVVDSYYDSTTGDWWRKYADGWIEQGGYTQSITNVGNTPLDTIVNLLLPMADTKYSVSVTGGGSIYTAIDGIINATSFYLYTLNLYNTTATNQYIWRVCGMGASA